MQEGKEAEEKERKKTFTDMAPCKWNLVSN
jgi:hypothetical protein